MRALKYFVKSIFQKSHNAKVPNLWGLYFQKVRSISCPIQHMVNSHFDAPSKMVLPR